jgi:hypothetical protein
MEGKFLENVQLKLHDDVKRKVGDPCEWNAKKN